MTWNRRRADDGSTALGARIARSLDVSGREQAILILNRKLPRATAASAPGVSFALARAFTDAVVSSERFFVYRVATTPPAVATSRSTVRTGATSRSWAAAAATSAR